MAKKQTSETIREADFTETKQKQAAEVETETTAETSKFPVLVDSLKPLDPRQSDDQSASKLRATLIVITITALLVLAGLYLRGLQLATT